MDCLLLGVCLLGHLQAPIWAVSDALFTAPNPPVPGLRKASPADHKRHVAPTQGLISQTQTRAQRLLPKATVVPNKQKTTTTTAAGGPSQNSPHPGQRKQTFRVRKTRPKTAPSLIAHSHPNPPLQRSKAKWHTPPSKPPQSHAKAASKKPARAAQPKQTVVVSGVNLPASKPAKNTTHPKEPTTALVQVADVTTSPHDRERHLNTLPSPEEYAEINREIARQVRSQESFELSDGDDPMLAEWGRVLLGLAIVLGILYSLKFLLLKWRASRPHKKRTRRLPIPTPNTDAPQRKKALSAARNAKPSQKAIPTTPPSLSWQEVVQMIAESQSPDEDTAPASGTNPVGLTRLRRPKP